MELVIIIRIVPERSRALLAIACTITGPLGCFSGTQGGLEQLLDRAHQLDQHIYAEVQNTLWGP